MTGRCRRDEDAAKTTGTPALPPPKTGNQVALTMGLGCGCGCVALRGSLQRLHLRHLRAQQGQLLLPLLPLGLEGSQAVGRIRCCLRKALRSANGAGERMLGQLQLSQLRSSACRRPLNKSSCCTRWGLASVSRLLSRRAFSASSFSRATCRGQSRVCLNVGGLHRYWCTHRLTTRKQHAWQLPHSQQKPWPALTSCCTVCSVALFS